VLSFRAWYIGFVVIVVGFGCGRNVEDPYPPATPKWVIKSSPCDIMERGIDAVPEDNFIRLEWHPNKEDDLGGYRIFRADSAVDREFALIANIDGMSGNMLDTVYIDMNVRLNVNYFYYIVAHDLSGNVSEASDTIRYRLIPKPVPVSPSGFTRDTIPLFKWNDFSNYAYDYVIKIENTLNKKVIWIFRLIRPNYASFDQKVIYNKDRKALESSLRRGVIYRWRVDAIAEEVGDIDIAGAESNWEYFEVE